MLLLVAGGPASAVAINVTTVNDTVANDGQCSLREAITTANTLLASGAASGECPAIAPGASREIILGAGTYRITRTGTNENNNLNGDFDIRAGELSIVGAGAANTVVRGDRTERVFDLGSSVLPPPSSGPSVEFKDLTIRDGGGSMGGGILVQGGYKLQITRCAIVNNDASFGGGLAAFNELVVDSSTFHGNTTTDPLGVGGGALYFNGPLAILTNSTFNANTSLTWGGAIYLEGSGTASLNHITLAENISDSDFNGSGGGALYTLAPMSIANSIVAGNADLGIIIGAAAEPDCHATGSSFDSQGYNLIGNIGADCQISNPQPSDQVGNPVSIINAQLLPLGAYGGPTDTQLPMATSPAVDRGAPIFPAGIYACIETDQRSFARPIGAACDIGAVESDDRIFADGFEAAPI